MGIDTQRLIEVKVRDISSFIYKDTLECLGKFNIGDIILVYNYPKEFKSGYFKISNIDADKKITYINLQYNNIKDITSYNIKCKFEKYADLPKMNYVEPRIVYGCYISYNKPEFYKYEDSIWKKLDSCPYHWELVSGNAHNYFITGRSSYVSEYILNSNSDIFNRGVPDDISNDTKKILEEYKGFYITYATIKELNSLADIKYDKIENNLDKIKIHDSLNKKLDYIIKNICGDNTLTDDTFDDYEYSFADEFEDNIWGLIGIHNDIETVENIVFYQYNRSKIMDIRIIYTSYN